MDEFKKNSCDHNVLRLLIVLVVNGLVSVWFYVVIGRRIVKYLYTFALVKYYTVIYCKY
jgi:hypothetical protein